jgi:predicted nucleotidyltransferase
MLSHIQIENAIKKASTRFPLAKVDYFGSYAENRATEESDLDLLVEFTQPPLSLVTIIRLKDFLETELPVAVDVIEYPLAPGAIIEIGRKVNVI